MEGDANETPHISGVSPQHVKDGVIDLVAGSLGMYVNILNY